jgi:sarcosine oxidase subunit beta
MSEDIRVVIIGAGVMGSSLAYELALAGADVDVLDRGAICSGSSGLNSGGVRHQFTSDLNVRLATQTIRRLSGFQEEFGVDIGFNQVGYMFLTATDGSEQTFRSAVEQQRALGVESAFLDTDDVRRLVPGIRVDDLHGAAFCASDGYLDSYSVVTGYASGARRLGARFALHDPVVSIETTGSRVVSVATSSGKRYWGDVFVNAAGVWATAIADLLGDHLPIVPWRSQVFMLGVTDVHRDAMPMVIDFDNGKVYFHPEGEGLLCGMDNETGSPLAESAPFDPSKFAQLAERLVFRMPVLEAAVEQRGWAGFMELTPDDNPLAGWSGRDNCYVAAGFSGHGMSIAPGLAVHVAREIRGEESAVDLAAFRPRRFEAGEGEPEKFSMR